MKGDMKPALWTSPFILICLAHFIMTVGFHACMPVFPLFLADRFGLVGIAMGMVVASYTASAIMTRPPTGYCLDRFGRRIVYLPGYFLFGLIYLLYPLADSPLTVGLVRFSHGALWGMTMGAANTAAVDLLPRERRGEGIGYFGLTMVLSMSVGPALGTWLAEWQGYSFMFTAITALNLTGFLILCKIPFPAVPLRAQPFSMRSLLEKSSLPVSFATLVFCIPFSAVMNYSAVFARTLPGASAGIFYLCVAIGTALTRLFTGRLFDHLGPGRIINSGYALSLSGCLMMAAADGPLLFSFAGLVLGLGNGVTLPVFQAMINALVPPQLRGAANATQMTAFDLGICLGLLSISHLQAYFGWSVTYILLAVCVLASGLIFRFVALPRYLARPHY